MQLEEVQRVDYRQLSYRTLLEVGHTEEDSGNGINPDLKVKLKDLLEMDFSVDLIISLTCLHAVCVL